MQPRVKPTTRSNYQLSLLTIALLMAGVALLSIVVADPVAAADALHRLRAAPDALPTATSWFLGVSAAVVMGTALFSYLFAAQLIRFIRVAVYVTQLHDFVSRQLRVRAPYLPIERVSHYAGQPTILQAGAQAGIEKPTTLARALESSRLILLDGEPGSGKTTAALSLVFGLTRKREITRIFWGRAPLPVLIPLAGFSAAPIDADGKRLTYCAEQVARFGSPAFASRFGRIIRKRRLVFVCDDLASVSAAARATVLRELAALRSFRRTKAAVIVVWQRADRLALISPAAPDTPASGAQWTWTRMAPLDDDDARQFARNDSPRKDAAKLDQWRKEVEAHGMSLKAMPPALLTALVALRSIDAPVPVSASQAFAAYGQALCESAASAEAPGAEVATLLSLFASALASSESDSLPLDASSSVGAALARWLQMNRAAVNGTRRKTEPLPFSPERIETLCEAAIQTGLLTVESDGRALRFTHSIFQATFAAQWLATRDDPVQALDPGLLRPGWATPVYFWVAVAERPAEIARRILQLTETSRTTALRARLASFEVVKPTAWSLALAATCHRCASDLTAGKADQAYTVARAERHLRGVYDEALGQLSAPASAAPLVAAFRATRRSLGPSLDAAVIALARATAISRFARAQTLTVLGMLATPAAIQALVDQLGDTDMTIRAALTKAFHLAGAAAVGPLQTLLTADNEWLRTRAKEILAHMGSDALADADTDTAYREAVTILKTGAPTQRAAAAQTLGALQSHPAVTSLAARLTDSDPQVRIAAAVALGQIADPEGLAPLRERAKDSDPLLRAALAEALGAYRSAEVVPDLTRLLEDTDARVRAAAASALGAVEDEHAAAALASHRNDPDPWVTTTVASSLRRLGRA